MTPDLETAYGVCRAIAKREAKNFYYGFLVLPPHKRDAMCAVYAFMRRADDISDDESLPLGDRRAMMANWIDSWHTNLDVALEDMPVFLAVRDVQRRFGVSNELLDQLVQGTTMDLDATTPNGVRRLHLGDRTVDQYETMVALEHYCYLVASVVGLTTIRIFGFTNAHADEYAVKLGLAFQLTNILRDVREDAERGRVYLPEDLMALHQVTTSDVATAKGDPSDALRAVLADIAGRAESLYTAADSLIPLIDPDSRAAMRVLVDIYHLLLKRIVAQRFNVFEQRVRVSTPRKLAVLAKGLAFGALARIGSKA